MSDDLKLVYSGSRVEALFLQDLLKENSVGSILNKTLESSSLAGWADGPTQRDAMLYVEAFNEEKAKKILEDYFEARDKQQ